MKNEQETRMLRARMEASKEQSERTFSKEPRRPRRYKLYDRIKDHVSLRTIDTIIIVTALLIIALLIFGIITREPQA